MTDPSPDVDTISAFGRWWRTLRWQWRVVLVVAAVAAALDLAVNALGGSATTGTGASTAGSSYATLPQGAAAWAALLPHFDHPVARSTVPLDRAGLAAGLTLVEIEPLSWSAADTASVRTFVDGGGRLVLAGPPPTGLLAALLGSARAPTWRALGLGTAFRAVGSAPEVRGVTTVVVDASQPGSWVADGATVPVLVATTVPGTSPPEALATVAEVGRGRVVLLASASPVQNGWLARDDNAAFAVDIAGSPGREVVFDEYAHGAGRSSTGLAALPARWRGGLALAAVAVALWVWSAIRRFGPPDTRRLRASPPRIAFVDGLATVLAATGPVHRSEAAAPLRHAGREQLVARLGLPASAPDAAIVQAASTAGVPPEVVAALTDDHPEATDTMAVGRAWGWLNAERGHRP